MALRTRVVRVLLAAGVGLVLGVAVLVVLVQWRTGFRNPHGTALSRPPLRGIVEDLAGEPALDDSGRFLALSFAADPLRVDVIDPATGELFDHHQVDALAVPRETSRTLGWDGDGRLWISVNSYAGGECRRAAVFEPGDRRFHAIACADRPADVVARAAGRMAPRSDPLPPGADLPPYEAFFVPRQSPDGSMYAVDVDEREYGDLAGRRFPVTDARLLDAAGRFVGQLEMMVPLGWAEDGSLVVYHSHGREFFADQWDVSLVAAGDIRGILDDR